MTHVNIASNAAGAIALLIAVQFSAHLTPVSPDGRAVSRPAPVYSVNPAPSRTDPYAHRGA
ncbi:MAG: hypothetical protein P8011_00060 [Acidihalobacter sp.]|uniref:hypothetical protein n=1 Tax=Acidihalobacter sp. TaxID=1872108 RepID=UPI00307F8F12